MLKIADYGYFYRPSEKVKNDFPNIKVTNNFEELKELINKII
jgi:hypothetical protein